MGVKMAAIDSFLDVWYIMYFQHERYKKIPKKLNGKHLTIRLNFNE